MCEIDLDPCEVWVVTTPVARKAHRCHSCDAVIRPGEKHWRTFTVFEGEASTERHCHRCERDMAAFAKAHEGARISPSGFDYLLDECISEEPHIRRWRAMRERIRARRPPASPQGDREGA